MAFVDDVALIIETSRLQFEAICRIEEFLDDVRMTAEGKKGDNPVTEIRLSCQNVGNSWKKMAELLGREDDLENYLKINSLKVYWQNKLESSNLAKI